MKPQRERHVPPGAVAVVAEMRSRGALVSGAQIENFREGWALLILGPGSGGRNKKAHYWLRDGFDRVRSLCGIDGGVRWVYGKGDFGDCARCVAHRAKPKRRWQTGV